MFDIRKLLHLRPKTESSTDLKDAIAAMEATLSSERKALEELYDRRGDVLLDGDAKTVAEFENDLREKNEKIEWLETMKLSLHTRLDAAESGEKSAELDRLEALREAAAAAGAAIAPDYETHAVAALECAAQIDGYNQEVRRINVILKANGRAGIAYPLKRAWPNGHRDWFSDDIKLPGPFATPSSAEDLRRSFARARAKSE